MEIWIVMGQGTWVKTEMGSESWMRIRVRIETWMGNKLYNLLPITAQRQPQPQPQNSKYGSWAETK